MDEFGQRLASLESRSAGSRADHHSFDTSTPTKTSEVRKDGCSTPTPNQQSALWADRPLDEVPGYSMQLVWDEEEPGDETATTSRLFNVSENTGRQTSTRVVLKGYPKPNSKTAKGETWGSQMPTNQGTKTRQDGSGQDVPGNSQVGPVAGQTASPLCGRCWSISDAP